MIMMMMMINENVCMITHNHYLKKGEIKSQVLTGYIFHSYVMKFCSSIDRRIFFSVLKTTSFLKLWLPTFNTEHSHFFFTFFKAILLKLISLHSPTEISLTQTKNNAWGRKNNQKDKHVLDNTQAVVRGFHRVTLGTRSFGLFDLVTG